MNKKTLNLLIIDDSPDDHELYREYLADEPEEEYRFFHAYSGEEGEKLYMAHAIDCIIIDYRLPDIDGIELLKRLTRNHHTVPAVMLTGEGNETVAVIAMQIGSQDYLPKQVITPQALKRILKHAMERTKLTQRMENYREELERSNQDLERFANIVAHDLKSPLRAITQHLRLIQDQQGDTLDEKSAKSMHFAIDGAERMRKLIDALFEFSKASFEKRSFAPINIKHVLDQVISNLQAHIEESGATITHDDLPTILADHVQLMQLLQNIISNALKFCKNKPQIHIRATREGHMWAISVQDNGIGIPQANQEKIFTIFKRLHSEEEYPGSGVGLAICERVVKNHGGHIQVESTPGKGSIFTMTLPAWEETKQEKAA